MGFAWGFNSIATTQPTGSMGTTVTPAQNAKSGAWAQVLTGANVARDVFLLVVNVNSNSVGAAARDTILDLGVDPAGGTSYTVLVPDLLVSCASPYLGGAGVCGNGLNYIFPIWIKAGSTVAARASINNGTVGTLKINMQVYGSPFDRRNAWCGTKVKAYGITAASSAGTSVTAGTASEGSWTSLGTIASGDFPKFWQFGMGCNDTTMSSVAYAGDLGIGDASNKAIVDEQRLWQATTVEQLWDDGISYAYYPAKPGDIVYGRLQASATADAGLSMAAYGVI